MDNVKSTQEFTHVKLYFYVRFQFLRTLTCVDKNATVEIHLKALLAPDPVYMEVRWPKSVKQTRTSRHKRKLHGTNKNSHGTNENFTAQTKTLTAQTKTLTAEVNLTAEMAVYFTRAVTQSLKIWRNR